MEVRCALHKRAQPLSQKNEVQPSRKTHHATRPVESPNTQRITASHAAATDPSPVPLPAPPAPQVQHSPDSIKCPYRPPVTVPQPAQMLGCAPILGAGLTSMVGCGKPEKTYTQLAADAKVAKGKLQVVHAHAKGVPNETQKRAKQVARACAAAEDTSLAAVKNILNGPHSQLAKQSAVMALFSAKLHYYEAALTAALNKLAAFKDHDEGRKRALLQCESRLRDLQVQIEKNNDQQRYVSSLLSNCLKNHECESRMDEKNKEIKTLQDSLFRSSIEKDKIKSQKDRVDKILEEMANESRQGAYIQIGAIPALFESTVSRVRVATENFAKIFLLAMRKVKRNLATDSYNLLPGVYLSKATHIAYVFQAYVSNQMFLGFEEANLCMYDVGLEDDKKRRRDCFMQFSHLAAPVDSKEEDPFSKDNNVAFQRFCCNKFMAVVPPWLERALFKDLRNRERIDKGEEPPNTQIYDKLKDLAGAVWLLHRLATSFKPAATIFRIRRGADVDLNLMQLVVPKEEDNNFTDKVGFMIMPGFEAKATTVKSLVYLEGPKQSLGQLQQQQAAAGAAVSVAPSGGPSLASPAAPKAKNAPSPRKRP